MGIGSRAPPEVGCTTWQTTRRRLENSDCEVPSGVRAAAEGGEGVQCRHRATTHHSFRGSFSAVSTPIFATKYSFCSIFQDLQNELAEFSKMCKKKITKSTLYGEILEVGAEFRKISEKIAQNLECQRKNIVDLEKCCKMSI